MFSAWRLFRSFALIALWVAALWWIRMAETLFGWDFIGLGVHPRHLDGLLGIVTAPLIHGSFAHVFANTLPILVLGTLALYAYPRAIRWMLPLVWIGSGVGVWLTARNAYHIGASGVATGLMFFLFLMGVIRRDRLATALSMLAFFLYGGMVWGIFPHDPEVSFESHFWGAVMGVVAAVFLHRLDAGLPRRRYRWEVEPEEADDPVIGDLWKYARGPEIPAPPPEPADDPPESPPRG